MFYAKQEPSQLSLANTPTPKLLVYTNVKPAMLNYFGRMKSSILAAVGPHFINLARALRSLK
jgi:hypothetical protein